MIQQSHFAGLFYPSKPDDLEKEISLLLSRLKQRPEFEIKGVIAPHAGYQYSGSVTAESLFQTKNKTYETVIIIGPSHRYSFKGASCLDKKAYQTPLGTIAINQEKQQAIIAGADNKTIFYEPKAYENEHSIEVILPFLQTLHPATPIIPIIMGQYTNTIVQSLAMSIIQQCDPCKTLIITSTDFSHFFSAQEAQKKDFRAIELIKKMSINLLQQEQEQETIQLCGLGPLLVMLTILDKWGVKNIDHLSYSHSGMVTGDDSSVVGYNSFRFY